MQINRRSFLKILMLVPVVGVKVGYAGDKDRLSISSINIFVPAYLLGEKNNKKANVHALSIAHNKTAKAIVLRFEGNRQLTFNTDASVQRLIRKKAGRPTCDSMRLKRIISYGLDGIFFNISSKRHPEKGAKLRGEFDALQAEEVINVVTVGAIYDLLSKLDDFQVISSVSWDAGKQRFKIR